MTITIAYVILYVVMTVVGVAYGYPVVEAAFEGVSVAANTGLSCGVTSPAMPDVMKVLYIGAMWLGRLEFMSAFALAGFFISVVRGRG
jgi:trk system potassium uptake protein TrkH